MFRRTPSCQRAWWRRSALLVGAVCLAGLGPVPHGSAVPPSGEDAVLTRVAPAPVPVRAAADSFVRSDRRRANFGDAATWSLDANEPVRRAYLKFAVPPAPAGQTYASATLHVLANKASRRGFSVHSTLGRWTEAGVTWANQPGRGSLLGRSAGFAGPSQVSVDVAPSVLRDNGGVVSLRLQTRDGAPLAFPSREVGGRRAARLVLTTAPASELPSTEALLARKNLIYGSEIGAWETDGGPAVNPATGIHTLVKAAEIPLIRFALHDVFTDQLDPAGNPGTQTRADFNRALDGIRDVLGAEPLIKLLPITKDVIGNKGGALFCPPPGDLAQNLPYYKSIVKQAGDRVKLYESNNEMEYSCSDTWGFDNAGSTGVSTLLGKHFARNMPALKKYARGLGFEILTVGYIGVSGGFGWGDSIERPRMKNLREFLVATHEAYVASGNDPDYIPDAVSVHAYPYSGDFGYDASLADIIDYWDAWTVAAQAQIDQVWGPAGSDIRLAVSEWNAGNKYWSGFNDDRVERFYTAWLRMLRRNDYWFANQFAIASNTSEPYDMIRDDGTTRRQYDAFKAVSVADSLH